MMRIWGSNDDSNIVKVMWCLDELGVEHERVDWGGVFGGSDGPEYRRKNPNGRMPTLEEPNGFTVWESGAVIRYLCAQYNLGSLHPEDLRARATADKWMDWSSLIFADFNRVTSMHVLRMKNEALRQFTGRPVRSWHSWISSINI